MTNFQNLILSSLSTGCAEFLTLPICTIKTNYQNIENMKANPSISEVIKKIYREGGIRRFYVASYPAIGGQIFSTTSKYTIYRYLDSNPDYPIKNKFLNGMTAGIISSLFTHPLDVIKVHLQMEKRYLLNFQTLYRGYSKTFVKIGVSSSLFFPLYDTIKSRMNNSFIASTSSAVIACVIMHPIDYLKTRQMSGLKIYDGYSPLTYYRGLSLTLLRVVPHFVITMGMIEFLGKKFS